MLSQDRTSMSRALSRPLSASLSRPLSRYGCMYFDLSLVTACAFYIPSPVTVWYSYMYIYALAYNMHRKDSEYVCDSVKKVLRWKYCISAWDDAEYLLIILSHPTW